MVLVVDGNNGTILNGAGGNSFESEYSGSGDWILNGTDRNGTERNGTMCGELHKKVPYSLYLLASILFAPAIYMLIALIIYGIRKSMHSQTKTTTMVNVRFDGYSKIILFLLILVQLACLTRLIVNVFFNRVYYERSAIFNVFTGIAYHIIPLILWIRQRHIYQKPGIRRMETVKVKTFSYFALFCVISSIVAIAINEGIFSTSESCDKLLESTHRKIWIVMLIFDVIFQIILFSLFVHPLLEHKRQMKIAKITSFRSLRPAILKILYSAIACLFANLVIVTPLAVLRVRGAGTPLSCISLLIQTLAIIASYSDWKVRLFPFMTCYNGRQTVFPTTNTLSGKGSVTETT